MLENLPGIARIDQLLHHPFFIYPGRCTPMANLSNIKHTANHYTIHFQPIKFPNPASLPPLKYVNSHSRIQVTAPSQGKISPRTVANLSILQPAINRDTIHFQPITFTNPASLPPLKYAPNRSRIQAANSLQQNSIVQTSKLANIESRQKPPHNSFNDMTKGTTMPSVFFQSCPPFQQLLDPWPQPSPQLF